MGIIDFKKDYWPRSNIVNDKKGDFDIDCYYFG